MTEQAETSEQRDPVIAVGLLTQTHLNMLGSSLKQVFPITQDDRFQDLLAELDKLGRERPA